MRMLPRVRVAGILNSLFSSVISIFPLCPFLSAPVLLPPLFIPLCHFVAYLRERIHERRAWRQEGSEGREDERDREREREDAPRTEQEGGRGRGREEEGGKDREREREGERGILQEGVRGSLQGGAGEDGLAVDSLAVGVAVGNFVVDRVLVLRDWS